MRALERSTSCPPSRLPDETVELLALLHAVFSDGQEAVGGGFEDPTHLQREMNRASGRDIPAKLAQISCALGPAGDVPGRPFVFTEAEVEALPRREHERWMATALSEAQHDPNRLPAEQSVPRGEEGSTGDGS